MMSDWFNIPEAQTAGSLAEFWRGADIRTLGRTGLAHSLFGNPAPTTATEIARQTMEEVKLRRRINYFGAENPLSWREKLDLGEPSTENILREMGGINMNGRGFVTPDSIDKVIVRTKDGREFECGVRRAEYMPGPFGREGYSELTVCTMKQTATRSYGIKDVIFNNPYTIVKWDDGTKTIVCCQDNYEETVKIVNGKKKKVRKYRKSDGFNPETGLAMAIVKKHFGNRGNYNNIFHKYIPESREDQKPTENTEEKAEE